MEAKPREPKMCVKCRLHGVKTLYKGGHGRLCQFRTCRCEHCTKYEVARNYENSLRAHVQDLEERSDGQKLAEAKVEIDVKPEVKTEPSEYFSSDEEDASFGRRIYPNSVSLDASEDDLDATAGISLNQSDDLNLSSQSSVNVNSFLNSPNVSEEFCPYCEDIPAKPLQDHIKTCATAKKFEETEDVSNIDQFHESDLSDTEMPNELDLSPNPTMNADASDELPDVLRTPPFQCPICLSDFPRFSPEELEAHAGSCHDFYATPDVRTCFMCDQEFSSAVPVIEFQHHVEGHFKEKDLQEQCIDPQLLGTENDKKRKLDSEAPLKTSTAKLTKQFQESHQTHCSKKSSEVSNSPKSSKHQVKSNSLEKRLSLGSSQIHSNGHSFQMKQSPGSSQTQAKMNLSPESSSIQSNYTFAEMKQSPGPSQHKVKKEEFAQIKHTTEPSLTQSNVKISERKEPPTFPPNSDPHIQSLISRFDESCSQPAVHQIFVAADMVGLIIGEKAWFKKKVLEDTGVTISVENRSSQVSGPVAVTLIGPSVNLPKAVAMIQLKLGPRVGLMHRS